MKVPTYERWKQRRSWPYFYPDYSPKPRIFGMPVRRGGLCWKPRIYERKRFDPLYGSARWVNREWPDDWRPFHTRVQSAKRRRDDWIFKMRMRAVT